MSVLHSWQHRFALPTFSQNGFWLTLKSCSLEISVIMVIIHYDYEQLSMSCHVQMPVFWPKWSRCMPMTPVMSPQSYSLGKSAKPGGQKAKIKGWMQ